MIMGRRGLGKRSMSVMQRLAFLVSKRAQFPRELGQALALPLIFLGYSMLIAVFLGSIVAGTLSDTQFVVMCGKSFNAVCRPVDVHVNLMTMFSLAVTMPFLAAAPSLIIDYFTDGMAKIVMRYVATSHDQKAMILRGLIQGRTNGCSLTYNLSDWLVHLDLKDSRQAAELLKELAPDSSRWSTSMMTTIRDRRDIKLNQSERDSIYACLEKIALWKTAPENDRSKCSVKELDSELEKILSPSSLQADNKSLNALASLAVTCGQHSLGEANLEEKLLSERSLLAEAMASRNSRLTSSAKARAVT